MVLIMIPHSVTADESYDSLLHAFENPDPRYAGAPFFSWNDRLESGEIRRQLGEMHRQGLGGAFLHPRAGMTTPYLSDKYFDMYGASIEEGKRLGFDIWLYDEDGWPSGSAGGRVMKRGPEYSIKTLMCSEIKASEIASFAENPATLAIYSCQGDPATSRNFEMIRPGDTLEINADTTFLRAWVYYGRYGTLPNWFADLLEPKAVDAFIEMTHEKFKARFAKDFGGVVPGIFSDEPNYSFLPWTNSFPEYFEDNNGYDIRAHLPLLFYRGDGFGKIRYDFFRTMTDRFIESFTERIYNWCDENNLQFTGHMLHEDNLVVQTAHVGAAMPHYEFMHMPGVDHLSRDIADPLLVKQVASVAHQLGKRRVLSELFGTAGWNASFEDLKLLSEWQYVLGVNFPCQHLAHYSLRGARKRDFPLSFNDHQPWWQYYHVFNEYTARLLTMLTQGSHECGILLLNPIESAWILTDPSNHTQYKWNSFIRLYKDTEVMAVNNRFSALSHKLLAIQHDYDYGDERIIARHGSVDNGRFVIGQEAYHTVIIPDCVTLRASTLALLEKFRAQGGKVFLAGRAPTMVGGEVSERLARFCESLPHIDTSLEGLDQALSDSDRRSFVIERRDGGFADSLYVQERSIEGGALYYCLNISRQRHESVRLHINANGTLEEWNAFDGSVRIVPVEKDGDETVADLDFAPIQSHMLFFREGVYGTAPAEEAGKRVTRYLLDPAWRVTRNHPNALVLDICRYKTDEMDDWSEPVNIMTLEQRLTAAKKNTRVNLRYTVKSEIAPPEELALVLETSDQFDITINGQPYRFRDSGQYWERNFRKSLVGNSFVHGENIIELGVDFMAESVGVVASAAAAHHEQEGDELRFATELEAIYLIGNFALKRQENTFVLTAPEDDMFSGQRDFTAAGYPFYAGSLTYSQTVSLPPLENGRKAFLTCGGFDAVLALVRVNGMEAGYFTWQPYECDISSHLQDGKNTVEIELVNSLRNLLGPHHHSEKDPHFTGPWNFTEIEFPNEYHVLPFALKGPIAITVTE